jgi:hypothetical protein
MWWPLSKSEFSEFGIYLQDSDGLNLASFYQILPYFSDRTALASRYSKVMVHQITDSAPSKLQV